MARTEEVKIRIQGKDQATPALKKVAGALKGMVGAYLGFRAVKAVIGQVKDMIRLAGDQEKAEKRVAAALKSTKNAVGMSLDELKKMASTMQANTAISDDAVLSAQAMALTFTNIGHDVFPGFMEAAADVSVAMGTGMKESIIQLGKAIQDPDKGIAALSRVGINVDEIKAKFTETMPVIEKQKLIIAELGVEFGGMAEAMGSTFQGRITQIGNLFGDAKEKIGDAVVKSAAWKNLLESISKKIGNLNIWLESNRDEIQEWGRISAEVVKNLAKGLFWAAKQAVLFVQATDELFSGKKRLEVKEMSDINSEYAKSFEKIRDQVRFLQLEKKSGMLTDEEFAEKNMELSKQLNDLTARQYRWQDGIKKTIPAIEDYSEKIGTLPPLFNKTADAIGEVNEANEEMLTFADIMLEIQIDLAHRFLETNDALAEWKKGIKGAGDETESFGDTIKEQAGRFMGDFVSGFVDTMFDIEKGFDDLVKTFTIGMAKMIAKMLIFKGIKMALGMPYSQGGLVPAMQHGGLVYGQGGIDNVPARLTAGEYVMRKDAVRGIGVENLERMNREGSTNNSVSININMSSSGDAQADSLIIADTLEDRINELIRRRKLTF